MHSIDLPPITTFTFTLLVLLFLFSVLTTTSLSSNETLSACNNTFNCGHLVNVSYPFTGGDRPALCGHPDFQLSCVNNSTELTIDSLTYRVLRLDPQCQTLTVARLDLWNQTCPQKFVNSSLVSSVFSFGAGNTDLTISYHCNSSIMTPKPSNLFQCNVNGLSSDSYFLVGAIPSDPIMSAIRCNVSIRLPILDSVSGNLTSDRSMLAEALMEGFNLNYSIPHTNNCSKCLESGGQCGYDSDSDEPICICGDRFCRKQGGNSNNVAKILGISATILGSIIISSVIMYNYKKKRNKTDTLDVEKLIMSFGSFAPKRYNYFNVKKITNSFAERIGKGGFGIVYKGKLPDGHLVAVKVLNDSKHNGEDFINEVASIGRCSHVNVVTLVGFCYERSKRALIYEYMPNGSLDKFIFGDQGRLNTNRSLQWTTLYEITIGIARGLEYLHRGCNTGILHFDIKPQNILLDEKLCPKISDFGLAKLWIRQKSIMSMIGTRGTVGYIAPEVFSRNFGAISHKSDVYSYGMLVLEIVGGRKNVDAGVSHTSQIYYPDWIYENIESGKDFRIEGITSSEDKEIAKKMILMSFWCIQTRPSNRPSMSKVIEMLEGSSESLQIPPKPFLYSPERSTQQSKSLEIEEEL